MDPSELPEDTSLWPNNSMELLGVSAKDDAKVAKVNYTRLIKRFKPERYPDQFQRIRAAYEDVCSFFEFYSKASFVQNWPVTDRSLSSQEAVNELPHVRQAKFPPQRDEAADLVAIVLETDASNLTTTIQTIKDSHWSDDLFPRKILVVYWLTKLNSTSPKDDTAAVWLLSHLHKLPSTEATIDLARRELLHHPHHLHLVQGAVSMDSLSQVEELSRLRWEAALRIGDYAIVANDLTELLDRYFDFGDRRDAIAYQALQYLYWSTDQEHEEICRRTKSELESMEGLRVGFGSLLDELDTLAKLSRQWKEIMHRNPQLANILKCIPWSYVGMESDATPILAPILVAGLRYPENLLLLFGHLIPYGTLFSFASTALMNAARSSYQIDAFRFHRQMYEIRSASKVLPAPVEIAIIESFLVECSRCEYDAFRSAICRFCYQSGISIEKVAKYLCTNTSSIAIYFRSKFFKSMDSDAALQAAATVLTQLSSLSLAEQNQVTVEEEPRSER